jgi:hypothetical protein
MVRGREWPGTRWKRTPLRLVVREKGFVCDEKMLWMNRTFLRFAAWNCALLRIALEKLAPLLSPQPAS